MKHDRADEKYDQLPILQQRERTGGFGILVAFLPAACHIVINLIGTDDSQNENGWERTRQDEEKDAAIGDKMTKQANRHGGQNGTRRAESLIACLTAIKQLWPTIPSETAQIAGPKKLEEPPIKTWADITDQKVGTSTISNADIASATIPAAINARLERRWSTSAPAGVWVRMPAIPPRVSAIPTRYSFREFAAR